MLWRIERCCGPVAVVIAVDNGLSHGRYFLVDSDGNVLVQQEGIFRSNCMDCLDRTNVIQSLLARRSLQSQLQVSDIPTAELGFCVCTQPRLCSTGTVNTLD